MRKAWYAAKEEEFMLMEVLILARGFMFCECAAPSVKGAFKLPTALLFSTREEAATFSKVRLEADMLDLNSKISSLEQKLNYLESKLRGSNVLYSNSKVSTWS